VLTLSLSTICDDTAGSPLGRSCVWENVTPYVVTRHAKEASASEALVFDVRAECRRLGLVEPIVAIRSVRSVSGIGLTGDLRLTFPQAVSGPLVLGRTRYFGGGLFLPIQEPRQP
jgi:CRISPR-associated protein Csb2